MITTQGSYNSSIPGYPTPVPYLIHKPKDYNPANKYPLLISFSGNVEKYWSGINPLKGAGINNAIINKGLEIPFIVFSPQTSGADYDNIGEPVKFLPGQFANEAAQQAQLVASIDSTRIYVTGLSMGSEAVYNALIYYPQVFAAGVAIAGWCTDFTKAPKVLGAIWDIKYTYIDGTSHGLWNETYQDTWESLTPSANFPKSVKPSNIYTWLLQFSNVSATVTPPVVTPPVVATTPYTITIKDATGKVLLNTTYNP